MSKNTNSKVKTVYECPECGEYNDARNKQFTSDIICVECRTKFDAENYQQTFAVFSKVDK